MDVLCPSLPKKTLCTFPSSEPTGSGEETEIKIICLNVNGLRSAIGKNLAAFVAREQPDILCLGETKLGAKGFEKVAPTLLAYNSDCGKYELFPGYEHIFNCSTSKEGYASSAVLVRSARAEVLRCQKATLGVHLPQIDGEGRVITLEFPTFYLVHAYVPNSGRGGPTPKAVLVPAKERAPKPSKPQSKAECSVAEAAKQEPEGSEDSASSTEAQNEQENKPATETAGETESVPTPEPKMVRKTVQIPGNLKTREKYEAAIKKHILSLSSNRPHPKPVIYCGDLNVAHQPIDLYSPETNAYSAGFTDEERGWLSSLLDEAGLVDTFREKYPTKVQYSWYSSRAHGKATGRGWRIDYFLVSRSLAPNVVDSTIMDGEADFSDHIPIMLRVKV